MWNISCQTSLCVTNLPIFSVLFLYTSTCGEWLWLKKKKIEVDDSTLKMCFVFSMNSRMHALLSVFRMVYSTTAEPNHPWTETVINYFDGRPSRWRGVGKGRLRIINIQWIISQSSHLYRFIIKIFFRRLDIYF